jgi:hypothetical protein
MAHGQALQEFLDTRQVSQHKNNKSNLRVFAAVVPAGR